MLRLLYCLILLFGLCVALPSAAQVYKYKDKNGIVHYTNIKPQQQKNYRVFNFPCYAGDKSCRSINWERVPLNKQAFRQAISVAAQTHAVEEALIRAIIHAESAYRTDALSPKGAQGLMQLMPATAKVYGVSDAFDSGQNINAGTHHLADLLERYRGDIEFAAAAYNAGQGAVDKYAGIPPYSETKEYVRRVKILYRRYKSSS